MYIMEDVPTPGGIASACFETHVYSPIVTHINIFPDYVSSLRNPQPYKCIAAPIVSSIFP